LSGAAFSLLEASLPHSYLWFFGAQQARKGEKKEKEEKGRNLA
jgi:hypothetical protein